MTIHEPPLISEQTNSTTYFMNKIQRCMELFFQDNTHNNTITLYDNTHNNTITL
jgi:hypothetical protein